MRRLAAEADGYYMAEMEALRLGYAVADVMGPDFMSASFFAGAKEKQATVEAAFALGVSRFLAR
jgi:hypothetical protein